METKLALKVVAVVASIALIAAAPNRTHSNVMVGFNPSLQSIGALAFGPNGVLYAADPQAATIFAIELGTSGKSVTGTMDVTGIDHQVAAMLGTDSSQIAIVDLAVDPRTHNSYLSVMRGRGADARPALLRVDGAGKIEMVAFESLKYSSVSLPNAPEANPPARSNPRTQVVMDMAYQNGKLYIAGLSNEEFASKLWAVPYPFANADRGTSVEIFHGAHGGYETRSPVYAFVPYNIGNEPYLIGGYLCTPLVKFPVSALAPGAKVRGTTIAELGAGNRPIDMILYKKDGKEFLLMANTNRGVMKIPTESFGTQPGITEPVKTTTAGIAYETIASMTGVRQLDLLDAGRSIVLARATGGPLNLQVVALP